MSSDDLHQIVKRNKFLEPLVKKYQGNKKFLHHVFEHQEKYVKLWQPYYSYFLLIGDNLFNEKTIHPSIKTRDSLLLNKRSSSVFRDATIKWATLWSKTKFDMKGKSKINVKAQGLKFFLSTKDYLSGQLLSLISESQDIDMTKYQPNINKDFFILDCILPLVMKFGVDIQMIFEVAKTVIEMEIQY